MSKAYLTNHSYDSMKERAGKLLIGLRQRPIQSAVSDGILGSI